MTASKKSTATPPVVSLTPGYTSIRRYSGTVEGVRHLNPNTKYNSAIRESRVENKPITPKFFQIELSVSGLSRPQDPAIHLMNAEVSTYHPSRGARYDSQRNNWTRTYLTLHDSKNQPPKWLVNAITIAIDDAKSSYFIKTLTARQMRLLVRSRGWSKDLERGLGDATGEIIFRRYTKMSADALEKAIIRYWFTRNENSGHIRTDVEYRKRVRYESLYDVLKTAAKS
ncbi:hypothetical protein SEA_FORZA_50 [Gordonia phage Forza]|uniref:Uncharacterized protein n=1 Tax=Gordonia phage Forza TaxID=2571247 RepID=A0A650EY82_9CAUD|nr:hypothetical protein PP303_gp050 [Gordonia phage Forza]QEM41520.1 hypothetical protein SEA_BOOPY_51 [Gordonia phage Boopy]QGT55043.1 hypothetical protein SEA_FORZA_50 [Gordonia phage Forza]UXE04193.1 hypothetical protein SEA_BLUENGOLD_49 [Gordonia phage BlueNGold]WBF03832.1 hypothetical protein SEA_MAREELIH_49 [Gordonia phage Mareelih]